MIDRNLVLKVDVHKFILILSHAVHKCERITLERQLVVNRVQANCGKSGEPLMATVSASCLIFQLGICFGMTGASLSP